MELYEIPAQQRFDGKLTKGAANTEVMELEPQLPYTKSWIMKEILQSLKDQHIKNLNRQ